MVHLQSYTKLTLLYIVHISMLTMQHDIGMHIKKYRYCSFFYEVEIPIRRCYHVL